MESEDPTWYLVLTLVFSGLAALGTIAATWVAVVVAIRSRRELNAAREQQAQAEATRISVFPSSEVAFGSGGMGPVALGFSVPVIRVRNDSMLPVSTVEVFGVLESGQVFDDLATIDLVPPSDEQTIRSGEHGTPVVAAALFTDHAGQRWLRTSLGETRRVHGDEKAVRAEEVARHRSIAELRRAETEARDERRAAGKDAS